MTDTSDRPIDRKERVYQLPESYIKRPIEERILDFDEVTLGFTPQLATRKWGLIVADEDTGATTREGVFAAGDNGHGPDLVITAVATAHRAAESIDAYLRGERVPLSVQTE